MKTFILKALLAACLFLGFAEAAGSIIRTWPNVLLGHEVYQAIKKSKKRHPAKVLVLGDSVAKQLYSPYHYNDTVYSLTCNRAVTMAGQYFLLRNYLQHNNPPEEVVLSMSPIGFDMNIEGYSTHYFLKPFYKKEYKPFMSEHILQRVSTIPYHQYAQFPFVKYTRFEPVPAVPREPAIGLATQLSADYLDSITTLCRQHGIAFHLYATPVSEDYRETFEQLKAETHNLSPELLEEYVNSMEYLPGSLFVDGVHLHPSHVPDDYYHFRQ